MATKPVVSRIPAPADHALCACGFVRAAATTLRPAASPATSVAAGRAPGAAIARARASFRRSSLIMAPGRGRPGA